VKAANTTAVMDDEQIELQAKLLNYFLGSNKSNINQSKKEKNITEKQSWTAAGPLQSAPSR